MKREKSFVVRGLRWPGEASGHGLSFVRRASRLPFSVSLWAAGAIDIVAALSLINIVLVVVGLGIALRFGVKLHD